MKKKIISVIVSAAILLGGAGMAACNSQPSEHEHIWNDGEVTVQPSCKEEGVRTYTCTVNGCKETKSEPIGKTSHTWDDGKITQEPGCSEYGIMTFTCSVCNETRTEPIDKIAHNYDGGTLTVIPSLTEYGEITYKCNDCDDIKTESVAPRDDFGEHFYTNIADATVWQYGYAEQYNSETGEFVFKRIVQTDDEQPAVWKAEGVEIGRDKIYSSNNAVIAYPADRDMHLNIAASFTGDEDDTCVSACLSVVDGDGQIKGEPTMIGGEAKDWNFSTEQSVEVHAGDTLYLVFVNSGSGVPGGVFNYRITSQCMHIWGEGEETHPASCTEYGEMTYTCNLCGETKTETIPMTAHDFTGDWTAVEGGHSHTCTVCGTADSSNVEPHKMQDGEIIKQPTATERGEKESICSECGHKEIIYLPTTDHTASEEYGKDDDYHWNICGTHDDCGERVNQAPHDYKELTELREEPTCGRDGKSYWECVCGATKEEIIPKESVPHDFENAEYVDAGDKHYQICNECGAAGESVDHVYDDGIITVEPTFWADGVRTKTCVCGHTVEEAVEKLNSIDYAEEFTTENQDGNWSYGKIEMQDWDHMLNNTMTQATDTNDGGDGWLIDGVEIKDRWMSAGAGAYISFTAAEEIKIKVEITVTRLDGMKRLDVRTDYENNARYHGDYSEDGVLTVVEEYTLAKDGKLYIVFTAKGEDSGFEQAEYSIKISRV